MADDLERAVLCQFDPSPDAAALKAEAAAFCERVKSSPRWSELFVEQCNATGFVEVKFWCLQALQEIVPKQYASLDPVAKQTLRKAFAGWILDRQISQQPPLLRNKLAQTVTSVVRLEYPKTWPSFFHDLIGALDQGPSVADMFCRILLAIDSDIISLDIHRTAQEQKVSTQLKDAMRDNCIAAVVDAWYRLATTYCTSDPELTGLVLQTLQKYISWMSIGLVVNNQFMPLLFDLLKLQDEGLQEASIDCLNEILLKGMEPSTKIHMVQKMGIVPCCVTWRDGLPGAEGDELREKCAKLLATLCSEILECWKRVENSKLCQTSLGRGIGGDVGCISMRACKIDIKSSVKHEANQICANCEKMIDALFPAVMAVIRTREEETAMAVVPFLSAYILRLKHLQERVKILPEKELEAVKSVLSGVLLAARYPSPSEIPPGVYSSEGQRMTGMEEIESVMAKRRDLFTIFKNIVRIHHEMVISTLLQQLQITLQNTQAPFQDVEVLITAVFELGEVQSLALQEAGCGPLAALVLPIIQAEIPTRHHQIVSLSILELYLRCYKVPLHHQREFPTVLSTFVGDQGIRHAAEAVSDRACYLFMKFVKSCRGAMRPYAMTILQSLGDFFTATLVTPKPKASSEQHPTDHRLYVFEAAGLLLGIEELEAEPQKEALVTMLHPPMLQLESVVKDAREEWRLLQSLEMIIRISKGFKQEQVTTSRPALDLSDRALLMQEGPKQVCCVGRVFIKCLELTLRIPHHCKSPLVGTRVISFLHRMIELLGDDTLPYLQPAFDVLLREGTETARMKEIATLMHQVVTAFGEKLKELLHVVLPTLLRGVWLCLEADWDWTGRTRTHPPGKTDGVILDETREKEDLQRLYYGLIYTIFTHCNAVVILELPSEALTFLLHTIQQAACFHVDIPIRRICVQINCQLVEKWSERTEADASLREYVLSQIGQELCIKSIMQSDLDVKDAATHSLFQDMVSCARTLYLSCGDRALLRMIGTLDEASLPAEFGEELEKQLRGKDDKRLKEFFKALVVYERKEKSEASM